MGYAATGTPLKAELGLRTEDQRRFRLAELAHPLADIFSGNLLRQIQIVLIVTRLERSSDR